MLLRSFILKVEPKFLALFHLEILGLNVRISFFPEKKI